MRVTAKDWMPALQSVLARQPKSVVVGGGVLFLLALWLVCVPPFLDIRRLSREWIQVKAQREETRRLMDRFYQMRPDSIPEAKEFPSVLTEIHERAHRQGVEILTVAPGEIKAGVEGQPAVCSVELDLVGQYHQLGEFLGELRDSSVLGVITIRDLGIIREEGILPKLRMHLSIQVALR